MFNRKQVVSKKFGVRHLQLLFASIHSVLDEIGNNAVKKYLLKVRKGDVDGSINTETLFSNKDLELVQAAVFITTAITTILSPYAVFSFNNKYFSIVCSILEIFIFCFINKAYAVTTFYGLVTLLIILSAIRSLRYVVGLNMISKWIPPREYSRAVTVLTVADPFGKAISSYALLIPTVGENLLYVLACFKTAHTACYFFFGAQDPQTCWILGKTEWHYLCKEIGFRRKIKWGCKIPWRNILRTPMLYGLMCVGIASKWFNTDFIRFSQFVPGYDDYVNVALLIYPCFLFAVAWTVDVIIDKEIITRNNLKKICSCFVFWGASIAVCFMCFYRREPDTVAGYLILAVYLAFGMIISEIATIFDLSPNYAVELYAIYTLPSFVVLAIKHVFLDPVYPLQGPNPFRDYIYVWYYSAFVLFVLNYGFLMFGDINWCQFDTFNAVDWRKESQISYP